MPDQLAYFVRHAIDDKGTHYFLADMSGCEDLNVDRYSIYKIENVKALDAACDAVASNDKYFRRLVLDDCAAEKIEYDSDRLKKQSIRTEVSALRDGFFLNDTYNGRHGYEITSSNVINRSIFNDLIVEDLINREYRLVLHRTSIEAIFSGFDIRRDEDWDITSKVQAGYDKELLSMDINEEETHSLSL